ncbi:MAG: hypothetical protein JXK93_07840 [Sphaerochaetaceae bacterium]|nr:hypothetical protein [Sphaerochaetaceae bacterium]
MKGSTKKMFVGIIFLTVMLSTLAAGVGEVLEDQIKKAQDFLSGRTELTISDSMEILKDLASAAIDEVMEFSTWDEERFEQESTVLFDTTIAEISKHLELLSNDGLVYKTIRKIKNEAIIQAERNRAAAEKERINGLARHVDAYTALATRNEAQIVELDRQWTLLVQGRKAAESALKELEAGRELFIAIAKTEALDAAIIELTNISKSLNDLTAEMTRVKDSILSSAFKG